MRQEYSHNPFDQGLDYSALRMAQFADEGNSGSGLPLGMQDLTDLNLSDEQRTALTNKVQEWNTGVQREFEKRANSLKQWEPYQQLGVHEVDPAELADLLELREVLNDDQRLVQWYQALGQQLNLNQNQPSNQPQPPGSEQPQGLTEDKIKEMFSGMLNEALSPFKQRFDQFDESDRMTQARQQIDSDLTSIDPEKKLTDDQKNTICQLALAYADPNTGETGIAKGFADYQKLIGATEQNMFANKGNQPPPSVPPGGQPTNTSPVTTYSDAKAAALERIRQANAT